MPYGEGAFGGDTYAGWIGVTRAATGITGSFAFGGLAETGSTGNILTGDNTSFETGVGNWVPTIFTLTSIRSMISDATRATSGSKSLKAVFPDTGTQAAVGVQVGALGILGANAVGKTYRGSAKVYTPTGTPSIRLATAFNGTSTRTTLFDQWQTLTNDFAMANGNNGNEVLIVGNATGVLSTPSPSTPHADDVKYASTQNNATSPNLLTNSNFSRALPITWNVAGATGVRSSVMAFNGTWSLAVTPSDSSTILAVSESVAVTAGQKVNAEFQARAGATPTFTSFTAQLLWSNGVAVSGDIQSTTNNNWRRWTVTGTVPAGVTGVQIRILVAANPTEQGPNYIDLASLSVGAGGYNGFGQRSLGDRTVLTGRRLEWVRLGDRGPGHRGSGPGEEPDRHRPERHLRLRRSRQPVPSR